MLRSTMTVLAKSSTELRSESVRSLYDQLSARLKDLNHLNGISGLLQWDQEVMMPSKAAASRAEQVLILRPLVLATNKPYDDSFHHQLVSTFYETVVI